MAGSNFFNPSSWFNNVSPEKTKDGNYIYSLTNPDAGKYQSVFNGGYSEANMMVLFQTTPELFFVVNAVASRVKGGVYKLIDKDGKTIEDNKLWNKITNRPNWMFSFAEFVWHAVMYKLVTGNRYGYAHVPSTLKLKHENIQALWLLPSHYVYIKMLMPRPSYLTTTSSKDYVEYYHYNGGDTMSHLQPEYVVHDTHVKVGDASDIITGKGISPFKAGEYPLSNIVAVYEARNVIYVRRGPLGAIISAARDAGGSVALTPGEKQEVIEDLTARHGVGYGKFPLAITNQPIGFTKFGADIAELEPFKETEASAAALCGIIGVPISLMPKADEAKFANLDISERNLYENVIFAEADSFCRFLTTVGRFDEIGAKVVVSFDHISCLQDDAAKNADALDKNSTAANNLYNEGHITRNELREIVGQEPVEGGDEYISEEERLAAKLKPTTPAISEADPAEATEDPAEDNENESKGLKIPFRKIVARKLFKQAKK